MSTIPVLSVTELASVVGAAGTGAKTVERAAINYALSNGDGNWFQRAGVFGGKVRERVLFSRGYTSFDRYKNFTQKQPGYADYDADLNRIRPTR